MDTLTLLQDLRNQVEPQSPAFKLLENIIDTQIGIWPSVTPHYGLTIRHCQNALAWRTACDYWLFDMREVNQ